MKMLYVLIALALVLLPLCGVALATDGQAPPSFIDRHWMEIIICVILTACSFAYLEDGNYFMSVVFFLAMLGYVGYVYFHH